MRNLLLFLLILAMVVALLWVGFTAGLGWQLYQQMEAEQPLADRISQVRMQADFTPFDQLPESYVNAVVAIEDARFWQHHGFSLPSLLRALVADFKARDWVEGGSTITQQLAKNLCFDQDKEISRKSAELFASFALEKSCTKEEIFELYVNSIYYGNGWYTVSAASLGYFGCDPSELNLDQATLLACYPNAPSVFMEEENRSLLLARRQEVVQRMLEEGYIDQYQAAELQALP